jgi:hypothetical protein
MTEVPGVATSMFCQDAHLKWPYGPEVVCPFGHDYKNATNRYRPLRTFRGRLLVSGVTCPMATGSGVRARGGDGSEPHQITPWLAPRRPRLGARLWPDQSDGPSRRPSPGAPPGPPSDARCFLDRSWSRPYNAYESRAAVRVSWTRPFVVRSGHSACGEGCPGTWSARHGMMLGYPGRR